MRRAIPLVALLLGLGALGFFAVALLAPAGSSASASASLTCSVKVAPASCVAPEVEVFRMSSNSNAHAGTPGGSSYGYRVCCSGVTGLGNSCSGTYATVLTLSGTDNAHVASDGSYGTKACLSVGAGGATDCTYSTSCGGSACVATISGATNAHVADCGAGAYETKVCCYASAVAPTPPPSGPVGGIAELPEVGEGDSSGRMYIALAAGMAAAVVALTAGAWYARRRWGR